MLEQTVSVCACRNGWGGVLRGQGELGQVVFRNCNSSAVVVDMPAKNTSSTADNDAFSLVNVAFLDNSGTRGGGVHVRRGDVACSMCSFVNNQAAAGAAIFVVKGASLSLSSSIFLNNVLG